MYDNFMKILTNAAPEGKKKELYVQDYLECHPELIPTPGLLNHHLHFESIISQFPLDSSLITDFAYLTKSTVQWRVFLVELESPDKKIFKASKNQISFRSEFNDALAQIRSWKVFIKENKQTVVNKLTPLLHPLTMRNNTLDFYYVLVYGRSDEYETSIKHKQTLSSLQEDESIYFLSYDSLIRAVENKNGYKKNILKLNKTIYSFKYLHLAPWNMFSMISPNDFTLSKKDQATLESWGYDINAWQKGESLWANGKSPFRSMDEEVDTVISMINNPKQTDK